MDDRIITHHFDQIPEPFIEVRRPKNMQISNSNAQISILMPSTKPGFPTAVADVFVPLRQEIVFLHGIRHVFQELFEHPEAAEVIKITPGAFTLIAYSFRHQLIIGITRINDRKTVCGNETLTVKQLLHVLQQNCNDQTWLDAVTKSAEEVAMECEPLRPTRNRFLAHLDLLTIQGTHPEEVPVIDGPRIDRCLKLLDEFMNLVNERFNDSYIEFQPHIAPRPSNIIYGLSKFFEWMPIIQDLERKQVLKEKSPNAS